MAKNSKKRKTAPEKISAAIKKIKHAPVLESTQHTKLNDQYNERDSDEDSEANEWGAQPRMIKGLVHEDELETTTETLLLLAENPSLIGLKALKPFKTAVHDYWRVANETTHTGTSLTSRISSALIDQRHVDALVFLSEMIIREQVPKLGALQRWVRECDAVLTPKMSQEEENKVWQVLDAILRTTQPEMISHSNHDLEDEGDLKPGTRLRWYKPFTVDPGPQTLHSSQINPDEISSTAATLLQPLLTTPGPDRRPPNKHPLILYFSPSTPFPLLPESKRAHLPTRHSLPGVPGAFIINSALETTECASIIQAAEKVGLTPDAPVAGSAAQLASVLAHNLVWVANAPFVEGLFDRIKAMMPEYVQGGRVKGINRRFRIYRYRPGALYRPHIDGAWPASSIDTSSSPPQYIYDSDPTTYSRLTLLIYLNDDFEGGCTTFFLPSSVQGVLEARPVKPRTGTVCVFPHGATKGSLLHEGSGVTSGAKYVIRTEVLYEVDKSERIDGVN